jgi:hypothetical protein
MRARLMTIALVAGCGFNPGGENAGGEPDADETVADAADTDGTPPPIDAPPADIDAPLPIDGPDIDAPPMCPVGYDIVRPSGRYDLRTVAVMHGTAKTDCENDLPGRTHLATFEDAGMFTADLDAINPDDSSAVYIGGHCTAVDCENRNNWFWDTGPMIEDELWPQGQPNLGLSQRVLVAQVFNGDWALNNSETTFVLPYLCECDPN